MSRLGNPADDDDGMNGLLLRMVSSIELLLLLVCCFCLLYNVSPGMVTMRPEQGPSGKGGVGIFMRCCVVDDEDCRR